MEPRVVRISVAPVKSLGLVHPDEVELTDRGVVGNRRFWLVDADRRLYNNKRNGPLVRIRPEWDEETRAVMNKVMYGTPVPPEIYERIRARAEKITQEIYEKHGLLDIAVDLIREGRDEE